jgi:hypothetical protein
MSPNPATKLRIVQEQSPAVRTKYQSIAAPLHTWEGGTLLDPEAMYVPTFQIRIIPNGVWHRWGSVENETACGRPYAASAVREFEIDGMLCPDCHSPHEMKLSGEKAIAIAKKAKERK